MLKILIYMCQYYVIKFNLHRRLKQLTSKIKKGQWNIIMTTVETKRKESKCNANKIEEKRIITDEQGRKLEMKYKLITVDDKLGVYAIIVESDEELAAECIIGDNNKIKNIFEMICHSEVTPCSLKDIFSDMAR